MLKFTSLLTIAVLLSAAPAFAQTKPSVPAHPSPSPSPTTSPQPAAPVPMTCIIGPKMQWQYRQPELFMDFSLSSGPASENLQPGQCAFLDRAVRKGEPRRICFTMAPPAAIDAVGNQISGEIYGFSSTSKQYAVLNAILQGQPTLENFMVHRLGNSYLDSIWCFAVDSFGT